MKYSLFEGGSTGSTLLGVCFFIEQDLVKALLEICKKKIGAISFFLHNITK
jgi:hypothetical protein